MLNCSLIKPKKIKLSVLFVFESDFCHSCLESFSQKAKKNWCWKTLCLAISRLISQVDAVPSKSRDEMGKFSPFEKSGREFCHSSTSGSWLKPNLQNENEEISISSQIQVETQMQVCLDSNLTCKSLPNAFAHFASNSWVACESLTSEISKKSVLKGLNWQLFKILFFSSSWVPHPKLKISSKTQPNFFGFHF